MFIPYEVDASFDHRPVVNWLVILGIILVFVLQVATSEKQVAEKSKKGIEAPLEEVLRVPTVENEVATKQVEKKQTVTGPMARFALNGWAGGMYFCKTYSSMKSTHQYRHSGNVSLNGQR